MDSLSNILTDVERIASGLTPAPGIVNKALGVVIVHLEKIAKQVGYDVEGSLPQLEDVALGHAEPEPSPEQKRIQELEAQLSAADTQETPEQAKIKALETQLAKKAPVE